MSDDYVSKLQNDLMTKFNHLCLMHNEPALHVSEHFAELRNRVDLDAEKQIEVAREKGDEEAINQVNGKRMEFIRILQELEKRIGFQPKPEVGASEIYASFEQRVEAFNNISCCSLDEWEDSYVQLAQEIINETERVEKRIFGEQTIIYCPNWHESEPGSLVYFGDAFLSRRDINCLLSKIFSCEPDTCHFLSSVSRLLVPMREIYKINKSSRVVDSLPLNISCAFAKEAKFHYVPKTGNENSNFLTWKSAIDKQLISYKKNETKILQIKGDDNVNTCENLFDIYYSSEKCGLRIENRRLESLHVNLLPSPFDRLTELILVGVHFEAFDSTTLLSQLTNLTKLKMQATYSKHVKFDLEFLRPLRKLTTLELTLPGSSSWDFSAFSKLYWLMNLKLEGSSFFYAEKLPRLSKETLRQILSAPRVEKLQLSCFEVEAMDRDVFQDCYRLYRFELAQCRISDSDSVNFGFPLCFINPEETSSILNNQNIIINIIHTGIRALSATSLAGMRNLRRLTVTGTLIADLPCGLFDDLPSLKRLFLNRNRIKHIDNGVFGKLDKLEVLILDDNPIETIEANAFAQLNDLILLTMEGCRLKSIDSKMFNGLTGLRQLNLNNNLIERIEVVAEDGRRINVAKANLNDEEKELVKMQLFTDFSQLTSLYLGGNKLEKLDLNCFSNLKRLHELLLSLNLINELSGVAGPELLSTLSQLLLNNNQLTEIDESALPKSLQCIKLAKNHLKRLVDNFFTQFTQLGEVDLSGNELTWTITEATFAGCSQSLKRINLSMNESIQVTEGAFTNVPHLERIQYDFSGKLFCLPALETLRIRKLTPEIVRTLKEFPREELRHLRQLKKCCISGCSIRTLTRNSEPDETSEDLDDFNISWFSIAPHLDLSGNLVETLDDPKLFTGFRSISSFYMNNNRLSRIHRDIFKCTPQLSSINLSGNKLSSIDTGLFRHLTSLKHLNLSSNGVSFLNLALLFRVCPSLESLNIADNQLDERSTVERIDSASSCRLEKLNLARNRFEKMEFVRDMTCLKHLNLRGNQIESVMSIDGENLLGRLRDLTHLDLSNNKISALKDEMRVHLYGKLDYFEISGNPAFQSLQPDSILSELI